MAGAAAAGALLGAAGCPGLAGRRKGLACSPVVLVLLGVGVAKPNVDVAAAPAPAPAAVAAAGSLAPGWLWPSPGVLGVRLVRRLPVALLRPPPLGRACPANIGLLVISWLSSRLFWLPLLLWLSRVACLWPLAPPLSLVWLRLNMRLHTDDACRATLQSSATGCGVRTSLPSHGAGPGPS